MEVFLFEPRGRSGTEPLYTYHKDDTKGIDLLQVNNEIIYRLQGNKKMDTAIFSRFMNDFQAFEAGILTSEAIAKTDEFLGKIGLSDEIPSKNKENLWVL